MEEAFSASYETDIRRIKANVSTQKMADAYYGKDYAGVMIDVPFEDFNNALTEAIAELHTATKVGLAAAQQLEPLFALLGHSEGLKTYFIELESAGTFVASHTKADHETFMQKARPSSVEPAAKVAEHRDLASAIRLVLNKEAAPSSAQRPLLPAKDPQAAPNNHQVSLWIYKASMLKVRDTHNPALGGHVVQGGTRLCLQPHSNLVELSASGLYNYSAPSQATVEHLARFYANVLIHGAQGGPPLRCTVAELLPKASSADQQAHPALVALKDAINAELDRAKLPSGP